MLYVRIIIIIIIIILNVGFVVEQATSKLWFLNLAVVFASHSTLCNAYYFDYIEHYTFYMTSAIIDIIIVIIIIIVIVIIIVIIISFMQGIYTYISETNYVPREYS